MAIVHVERLAKKFGTDVQAVDNLNLHINHGELISLLGPSGCGKTTTLRLLAGFLQPDGGQIQVDEKVIASPSFIIPPEKRNMSMIFQSYAIWPHKTVYQNVSYGLKFRNVSAAEADRKVRQMLEVVKLEHLADRYPSELSGGQQQRVALARALVVEPAILLLDEPLSNLDANLREEMRFEIRRLHDEFKITSVYVTHDQSEAMVIADRICVMNQGRIEQVGSPEDIYESPKTRFVAEFIGKTNLLAGTLCPEKKVNLGDGLSLSVTDEGGFKAGEKVWISVRPHNLLLSNGESRRGEGEVAYNVFRGSVNGRFYFGDAIDYQVQLEGGPMVLRVIAPPTQRFSIGAKVSVLAHPEHCILVGEK